MKMQQKNNFEGVVYKAQHNETGKMYIGITTASLEARKKDHIDKTRQGEETKFYEAIGTYGAEAFSWEQIDTATSVNELASKEREYIVKYNTQENGYNTDAGGGIQKQVYQYDLETKEIVGTYACLDDAAQSIGADKKAISKACYSVNQIYGGYC
ncbi:NUMOD1 domain-containing DNA-binding protein [Mesonia sp.]|uniref:NUMOD1 domain-containing DNA-binding protein n=1 Tax=Mesonia sp. TaxID=1960830 RepID=UPI003F96BAD9